MHIKSGSRKRHTSAPSIPAARMCGHWESINGAVSCSFTMEARPVEPRSSRGQSIQTFTKRSSARPPHDPAILKRGRRGAASVRTTRNRKKAPFMTPPYSSAGLHVSSRSVSSHNRKRRHPCAQAYRPWPLVVLRAHNIREGKGHGHINNATNSSGVTVPGCHPGTELRFFGKNPKKQREHNADTQCCQGSISESFLIKFFIVSEQCKICLESINKSENFCISVLFFESESIMINSSKAHITLISAFTSVMCPISSSLISKIFLPSSEFVTSFGIVKAPVAGFDATTVSRSRSASNGAPADGGGVLIASGIRPPPSLSAGIVAPAIAAARMCGHWEPINAL
ncbi:Hypothetical protein GbCGDNIH2_7311 [Granulibacter bethesdensis]|nr:Hypothetical protein GbCGDNIH2_7311 [Granulibacter bethesdensis]